MGTMQTDPEEQTVTPPGSTNGTLELKTGSRNESETRESDPCLEKKNPELNDEKFWEKFASRVQERTGLSRKWLFILLGLCLGIVFLVLVVIVLAITRPRIPHMFRYPICRNPGCLIAASQIQQDLNNSVSPCSDLWGAFCSSWNQNGVRPPDRPIWSLKEKIILTDSERIRDMITTMELPLSPETVQWKLRTFYDSCLDVGIVNSAGTRTLNEKITELGGWALMKNWIISDFVPMDALRKLHVLYGVPALFRIHVEPDPRNADSYAIRISPSGLGLPDREYYYRSRDDAVRVAYIEYIRDVAMYLGGATRSEASKFAEDIFGYETRLAEVTPTRASLRNPIATYHSVTLFDLSDIMMIPFHDILQSMFPEADISIDTDVIITSYDYLSELSQIITSTDTRTLNKYLIWCLVRKYIPYLNDTYTSVLASFHSALLGITKPLRRWEFCIDLVKSHMGLAVEYLMEKGSPIHEKTRQTLDDMFNNTLTVINEKISKFEESPLLQQQLQNKLDSVSLHVGLLEHTKTLSFLKQHYLSLKIIKFEFFHSVMNAVTFNRKLDEKMLTKKLQEGAYLRAYLSVPPQVKYVGSENKIIVPRVLVTEPFFDVSYPSAINYGRIGLELSRALISSVVPYGSIWTSEKKILSPFHSTVNSSLNSAKVGTICLSRYILKLHLDLPADVVNETSLGIATELSSVETARQALAKSEIGSNHQHQGGLEYYEDEHLFFVSYAQTQCSESTTQHQYHESVTNFKLSLKDLLYLVWSQLSFFQKAFTCGFDKGNVCPAIL